MKDATSFRTRKTSFYDKKSNSPFKISRSKFFNFLSCKRCFYLDRVKGLKEPSMPGWALNVAVDELLIKEFDQYRLVYNHEKFDKNEIRKYLSSAYKKYYLRFSWITKYIKSFY